MTTWLRLTLITATVGGGFTGIAITLQQFFAPNEIPFIGYVLLLGFAALFAFVTASGLIFVHNPARLWPLAVALTLQIPMVSSPIFAYKFAAGFQISVAIIGGRISSGVRLGSDFQINFFQDLPWGAGINIFALVFLVLVLHAMCKPPPPQPQPVAQA